MKYIELPSAEVASEISQQLYKLFSPRIGNTTHLFDWVQHPNKSNVLACINENETVKNYFWPDIETIFASIDTALGGKADPEQLKDVGNYLRSSESVKIQYIIPPALYSLAITKLEAKELGYFPEPG